MAKDEAFKNHVADLLSPLGEVRIRAMFGGYGIYYHDQMFALIAEGVLYLKVDDLNRPRFEQAGLKAWTYESPRGTMAMPYYQAPLEGLDDGGTLCEWARTSIAVTQRNPKKKKATVKKSGKRAAKKIKPTAAKKRN